MATIFEDDFNSYNDGNLIGQGGWEEFSGYAGDLVQGTVVKEGAKAVKIVTNSDVSHCNCKDGPSAVSPGRAVVYFYATNHASWATNAFVNIARLGETGAWNCKIQIIAKQDGHFYYLNSGGSEVDLGTFSDEQWYCIEIEWQGIGANSEVRYRINGGSWTSWVAPFSDWTTGLKWWGIGCGHNLNNNPAYIDYIAEYPYMPPVGKSRGYIF